MAYEGLSTPYPIRPEGHTLEAIRVVLGCLLNSRHTVATMAHRSALAEILQRVQRFRDVAYLYIHHHEWVVPAEGMVHNTRGGFQYRLFKGQDPERSSVGCHLVDADEQNGRAIPTWAFINLFSRCLELRNVEFSYRSVMTQYGDHRYDGQHGDADHFFSGGIRVRDKNHGGWGGLDH